ncbi:ABC-three component system middle component 1 [Malaciobacter canalis]|uniref:ABC-three component system middle component 1 n=1 Tax=Malaciobacter canalis TaxID=1912871 RepID=UPI00385114B2
MLINILEHIFGEFEFLSKELNRNDYSVSLFYKENSADYFIVLDKENITNLEIESFLEVIQEIYTEFKNDDSTNETFDKNTTFIMCVNGENNESVLSSLEEDPYIFKKNIITYSDEELEDVIELLNLEYSYENLLLNLNNEENFDQFKNNSNLAGYRLLSKLFIKLPFLNFERQVRELENLSDIIKSNVNDSILLDSYYLINAESFDINNMSSYEDLVSVGFLEGDTGE